MEDCKPMECCKQTFLAHSSLTVGLLDWPVIWVQAGQRERDRVLRKKEQERDRNKEREKVIWVSWDIPDREYSPLPGKVALF